VGEDNQKLPGLQVGRALAALAVAYFHSNMLFDGWPKDAAIFAIPGLKEHGYLGVNFFFAISGYVIASVCNKPGFSPREFVIKRLFRLYPVYWLVIVLTILLKPLLFLPGGSYKAGYIAYSMTLLPQAGRPFYWVSWSLEYEIVFYALACLIAPIFGVWGLAAVLFGLVSWAFFSPPDFFTFHLVATLNADFLAGVLAYLLRRPTSYVPAWLLVCAGLLGYWAAAVLQIPFTGSIGGFLLVSGLIHANWGWNRSPLKALVKIGDASYSLYLIHFILVWIPGIAFGLLHVQPPGWVAEPLRFAYIAFCAWISLRMWTRIEKPMIALGNRMAASKAKPLNTATVPISANK
jgi:exopolysaccharide production protein ExoZ